ncbi:MAG: DUF3526 domain-containing protein [Gammaproteobacteria bacterium]|nr:MAG: DUF3526 domain-containing protein [Gammaproteobacteria bacterium]
MIARLVAKELLELRRDGRIWMLLAILGVLAAGAALSTWQQVRTQHAAWHAASAGEQERWLAQDEKHPHSAAHYGVYAFRPPGPLATFDPGLDPYLPVTVWMEAHRQNEALYRPAQDAGSAVRFGRLTPATIVGALLPLLIVLVAAPAISGERERGTLTQLLAQGVAPGRWVLGKGLALATLLAGLLLPLWLLVTAVLIVASAPTDTLARWLAAGALVALYLGGFLLTCLFVSACSRSVRTALLVLLSVWAVSTLIAPRAVLEWAQWRHPTPSSFEFRQALQADLRDRSELDARLARRAAELLEAHAVDRVEQLPVNFDGFRLQAAEEHDYAVFDAHFGRLHEGYLAQERLLQWFGVLAPYLAFSAASSGLSGTDLLHYRHFADSAEQHRRVMQEMLNEAIYRNPEVDGQRYLAGPELWATVPEFEYSAPSLGRIISGHAPAFAVLTGWLLLPLMGLLRVAPRLQP